MAEDIVKSSIAEIRLMAMDACLACGGNPAMAKSLVDATLSAACHGRSEVGFSHFVDYLHSLRDGRIDGNATPHIDYPLPAIIHSDARGGIAQLGFDLAFHSLIERTQTFGIAILTQKNSYTAGELGYYVRHLAARNLVSIAFANAHALMATTVGGRPVFGTNPIAFGVPLPAPRPPLIIDQAASATAFVNIVRAAAQGGVIPEGWALDRSGAATTDPAEAMLGALLPFGGYKGANIAFLVEILAAGLAGAAWSLDAGNFRSGAQCPNTGMSVIAIVPDAADLGFSQRMAEHLDRLAERGVRIPGAAAGRAFPDETETIEIEADILATIRSFIA